jgi:lysophospholipase L1-like esterase
MNANKRVFFFILFSLILYLLVSYLTLAYKKSWDPFNRINLLSDIIHSKEAPNKPLPNYQQEHVDLPPDIDPADTLLAKNQDSVAPVEPKADSTLADNEPPSDIQLSRLPENISKDDIILLTEDSTQVALTHFAAKLAELKKGGKIKIRIAYLGDSMIEGDLLSQTLRTLLQQTYGGKGVGFVPITSQVAQFRRTAVATFSNGWKDLNFKNTKKQHLFLSGHVFFSSGNDWVKVRDNTTRDTISALEKYIFYGTSNDSSFVSVNKKIIPLQGKKLFNRDLLLNDKRKSISISTSDVKLPIYGLSFESEYGVIVDNFSFRGISGLEFARINTDFLRTIDDQNPYDLIIFQYGVNVMYKPDDTNFNWYKRAATPVINKMKACFPKADFLIVGTGDRAFRYPEGYRSAVGIEELIKVQASLALQTNCAFYSLYAAMGGKNSMVNWATQSPSLANKDYVHPNALGAKILGKHLFEALHKDANKLEAN